MIRISRKNTIYPNKGHGWENDSTMELVNLSKTDVYAGFCQSCFHTIRIPKFDTKKLYGEKATQVRAKHFANYFPNKIYGQTPENINIGEAFDGVSIENKRFSFISSKLGSFLNNIQFNGNTLKILDWGGGDGSVSNQYASILTYVTGCKIDNWIFDYAPWKHGKDNKRLSPKTVVNQAPFDIVILSHVLEHTDNPVEMMININQILKIGGILIIEIPDERMNIVRALLGKTVTLHYHVAWYSRRSLTKLLSRCEINRWETYYKFNSSYHGSPMTTILAIAQKIPRNGNRQSKFPIVLIETCSLIILTIKKIFVKLIRP